MAFGVGSMLGKKVVCLFSYVFICTGNTCLSAEATGLGMLKKEKMHEQGNETESSISRIRGGGRTSSGPRMGPSRGQEGKRKGWEEVKQLLMGGEGSQQPKSSKQRSMWTRGLE